MKVSSDFTNLLFKEVKEMLRKFRKEYHQSICDNIIRIRKESGKEYPNFSDSGNKSSMEIAWIITRLLKYKTNYESISAQTIGDLFEVITKTYIEKSFDLLNHIRPGNWKYSINNRISQFDQYEHLAQLEEIVTNDTTLASALGLDYIVKSDITIGREPVSIKEINKNRKIFSKNDPVVKLSTFLATNNISHLPFLHASISCKWTIRSDRSQNTRTEALNLIRNRKGNLPHIAAITAEPLPTRIATLALGTGDLDCVYHFALNELVEAVKTLNNLDQSDMLNIMIEGKRLRDISDLILDLAV